MNTTLQTLLQLKALHPQNLALRSFDQSYFENITPIFQNRLLDCMRSGIENPESEMGCYACLGSDYQDLKPFFEAVLSAHHKVSMPALHKSNWNIAEEKKLQGLQSLNLKELDIGTLSVRIRVGRNLQNYPLPATMSKQDRLELETEMEAAFEKLNTIPEFAGHYHSLTPGHQNQISDQRYQQLVEKHLLFRDMRSDKFLVSAGIASNWPLGRGCFISNSKKFLIWIGEEDHLRIIAMDQVDNLEPVFLQLKELLDCVETSAKLRFYQEPELGFVTSCPTNLGTAMRASAHLALPNLTLPYQADQLRTITRRLGVSVRGIGGEHTDAGKDGTVDISPKARFCISEAKILLSLHNGITQLVKLEKELADRPTQPSSK